MRVAPATSGRERAMAGGDGLNREEEEEQSGEAGTEASSSLFVVIGLRIGEEEREEQRRGRFRI